MKTLIGKLHSIQGIDQGTIQSYIIYYCTCIGDIGEILASIGGEGHTSLQIGSIQN